MSNAISSPGKKHPEPPLLCVPNELLHKIFTYLTPTEAANFRRLNKRIANIGVEYIVPVIVLALSEDSFDRLEVIARHPEIRKHVSSMVFDAIHLEDLDRKTWGEGINSHQYTVNQLDGAFARYQGYRHEQSQLRRAGVYLERITQALANLPSLNNIVLDTLAQPCSEIGLSTRKLLAAFGSRVCADRATKRYYYPASQAEVHAILNGAHGAGLRLETFTCSLLSWSYFSDSPGDHAPYSGSLTHLKSLDLVISDMEDIDGFIECLSTGRVLRFLSAAPYLDRLRLGVFTEFYSRFSEDFSCLEHFVGSFRWTLLVEVTIENIQTSENVFKRFLDRRSSTLRSVVLRELCLVDGNGCQYFDGCEVC